MESIIPAEPRRIRASQADEPLRGSFLFAPARDEELAQHAFLRLSASFLHLHHIYAKLYDTVGARHACGRLRRAAC